MEEVVKMTKKEVDRIKVLEQVRNKQITQRTAAIKLGLSDRQIRNLLKRTSTEGDKAIVSKKRGGHGNHSKPMAFKLEVLHLIQQYYSDFEPKLASEYLKKYHAIEISDETLRLCMISKHIWIPRKSRKVIHPPRKRRDCFGELIQIDGSHHSWFEERGPKCVLMVMIDDATSTITAMHFTEEENLESYYHVVAKHINTYGIPRAFYGDRGSTLTPRNPDGPRDTTQFQKATKELDNKIILAYSPEAKGRVERANRTLRDRLVKMLRMKKASTIEEANQLLEEFRLEHNQRFSIKPSEQLNAHRPLDGISLDHVLCIRETRTLTKNNFVQFRTNFYQISSQDKKIQLHKQAKIEIRQLLNGEIAAFFKEKIVKIIPLSEVLSPILDGKQILTWQDKKRYVPPKTHPYKALYNQKKREEMSRKIV